MTAINRPGAQPVTTQRSYSEQPVRARGERAAQPGNAAPATQAPPAPAKPQPQAVSAEIPPTPTTKPPAEDWTETALDKASAGIDALEKEIAALDLNSADGNKKMLLIQRKMQRLDEMIRLISTMWTEQHHRIQQVISNMRS